MNPLQGVFMNKITILMVLITLCASIIRAEDLVEVKKEIIYTFNIKTTSKKKHTLVKKKKSLSTKKTYSKKKSLIGQRFSLKSNKSFKPTCVLIDYRINKSATKKVNMKLKCFGASKKERKKLTKIVENRLLGRGA